MGLARVLTRLVFRRIEVLSAGAHSLVIEAMSLARDQDLGIDRVICETMLEQLTYASRYLSSLIWVMHDELPEDRADIALPAVALIAAAHRPRVDADGPARDYLVHLVITARDRAVRARKVVDRSQRNRESRISLGLESVRAHLQCVLDLFSASSGGLHQSYT